MSNLMAMVQVFAMVHTVFYKIQCCKSSSMRLMFVLLTFFFLYMGAANLLELPSEGRPRPYITSAPAITKAMMMLAVNALPPKSHSKASSSFAKSKDLTSSCCTPCTAKIDKAVAIRP